MMPMQCAGLLYLRSDFLLRFWLLYGILLDVELYSVCCTWDPIFCFDFSSFMVCFWILSSIMRVAELPVLFGVSGFWKTSSHLDLGCVWIEETLQFLVRIGWITSKRSFPQVIRNRNVSPISTYADTHETVGSWFRIDSHLIASYFFCSFFHLIFLVQQVKMLCI